MAHAEPGRRAPARLARITLGGMLGAVALAAAAAAADAPPDRAAEPPWQAPLVIEGDGPLLRLHLTARDWVHAGAAARVRIVDAQGRHVPFAVVEPPAPPVAASRESRRDVDLFPLLSRAASDTGSGTRRGAIGDDAQAAVDVRVDPRGGIVVSRRPAGAATVATAASSPGWLVDLGERRADTPAPQALEFDWSGPASASFVLETSADLRAWRPAGGGELVALAPLSPSGRELRQARAELPADAPRFVRLRWRDGASAPAVTAAHAITEVPAAGGALAAAAPASARLVVEGLHPVAPGDPREGAVAGAVEVDLPGPLAVTRLGVLWAGDGPHVAPVRVLARASGDAGWRDIGRPVFHTEGGARDVPDLFAPWQGGSTMERVRLVPDAGSGDLSAKLRALVVEVAAPDLVIARDGTPPFRLQAAPRGVLSEAGPLPIERVVPTSSSAPPPADRYATATLGPWSAEPALAHEGDEAQRRSRWRTWLLWGVLVGGVAGLGAMVWSMARSRPSA